MTEQATGVYSPAAELVKRAATHPVLSRASVTSDPGSPGMGDPGLVHVASAGSLAAAGGLFPSLCVLCCGQHARSY